MLQTAHEAVARIMVLARSLDGVISGEHGIGITKLEFLTDLELADFTAYKQRVDPEGRFNKGKLLRGASLAALGDDVRHADLSHAYTPSFGLMGHESLIMQQSDIGAISASIKDCLRCGKCKPVCATHVPRANLLYSPRNKILATSLLIEAFLYEEQTRRGVSLRHWEEFEDVGRPLHRVPQVRHAVPGRHRLRRRLDEHAQPAAQDGPEDLPARQRRGDVHAQRHQPADDQDRARRDGGRGHEGAARGQRRAQARRAQPDRRAAGHGRRRDGQGAGDPLHQQEDAGRPAQEDGARAAGHRGQELRPDHPRPEDDDVRDRGRLLLPGLRLRAPVLAGGPGHAGDAVARRRADGAAAGLPVLRLPAARLGPVRQGRGDDHRQPRAVPPRGQHAELPRHQDGGGQLRHLLRPAAGLQVRGHLPGLPHHRHPRVPAREEHQARGRAPATCTTTRATRR